MADRQTTHKQDKETHFCSHTWTWPRYSEDVSAKLQAKNELSRSRLSKAKALQTERYDWKHYMPHLQVGI